MKNRPMMPTARASRGSSSRISDGAASRDGFHSPGAGAGRSSGFSVIAFDMVFVPNQNRRRSPLGTIPCNRGSRRHALDRLAWRPAGWPYQERIPLLRHLQEPIFQRPPLQIEPADRPAILGDPLRKDLAQVLVLAGANLEAGEAVAERLGRNVLHTV